MYLLAVVSCRVCQVEISISVSVVRLYSYNDAQQCIRTGVGTWNLRLLWLFCELCFLLVFVCVHVCMCYLLQISFSIIHALSAHFTIASATVPRQNSYVVMLPVPKPIWQKCVHRKWCGGWVIYILNCLFFVLFSKDFKI